ncbi:MAG TPA: carboxymuconolactone decarboxylase family protein [Acidimicrobiales bacterium]|nr:carboxymuconolactone decarboxylase family protein [Acidimicrobiales bacterium]
MPGRFTQIGLGGSDPLVDQVYARFEREGREPIALYRTLAGVPWLLEAYNGLAVALRREPTLGRALRELVILRGSQLTGSDYEWTHHRPMAVAAGVAEEKITRLHGWRSSDLFEARERAALNCLESVHTVDLDDETFESVRRMFSEQEAIELIAVCAFYEMVARFIQALGVTVEAAYADFAHDAPSRISAGSDRD